MLIERTNIAMESVGTTLINVDHCYYKQQLSMLTTDVDDLIIMCMMMMMMIVSQMVSCVGPL